MAIFKEKTVLIIKQISFLNVRMVGLEPTTSALSVQCSNQLSYIRINLLYNNVSCF